MVLTQQSTREGTASFMNNEQVDFRASSENIAPAAEVLRAREVREARALALGSYTSGTSEHTEIDTKSSKTPEAQYKEQALAYIAAVSRNLSETRQHEVNTNWNLEADGLMPHFDLRGIFKKTLNLLTGGGQMVDESLRMPKRGFLSGVSERELLKAESAIGASIFGKIPAGIERDFFNLDATTWIWHQNTGASQAVGSTIRYEVQETGILKAQDNAQYSYIEGQELQDLTTAIQIYYEQVMQGIYKRDPKTGEKIAR